MKRIRWMVLALLAFLPAIVFGQTSGTSNERITGEWRFEQKTDFIMAQPSDTKTAIQITGGALKIGTATPSTVPGQNDAYITGTLEVDGVARFDATQMRLRGILYTLPAADGGASTYLQTSGAGVLSWAAGTSGTLDDAYNAGISITVDAGAVALTNNAANNLGVLTIGKTPVGAQSGDLLTITAGANASGDCIQFVNTGSGNDLAGSGATWSITRLGVATFSSISGLTSGVTISGGTINLNNNSNFATNINTGTSTGAVSIGGGTNTVAVNSSAWDISTAGAATGLTTISSSGDHTFATGTGITSSTTDTQTLAIKVYDVDGATYRNAILLTNANTPTIVIGTNNETLAIDTADWDISTTGDMTGIGAITMNGLLTGTLGTTISGAAVNLNVNSNFAVNIGTGTSNIALAIGGGFNTVAIDSSDWDISATGVVTGIASIAMDPAAANITLTSDGAADDFTIALAGATDSHLIISSTGTSANALQISTSAGGMILTVAGAAADEDLSLISNSSINLTATEAIGNQIYIQGQGAIAGNAINIATTDGGIVLTAGGAANGDITLTAGDALNLNPTGNLSSTVGGNASIAATGTFALSSSDWGITTAGVVTKLASIGFDSLSVLKVDTVSLSSVDIKALRATKKTLVASPGAGYYVEVLSVVLILDYGTAVYTESVDNLVVQYATSGDDITAAIEMTGFIDQAADTIMTVYPINPQPANAASDMAANAVELFNTGDGEFAGAGDGVMRVKVTYIVHPTGL